MALRIAMEWLASCSGCEISFLNIGEELVTLLTDDLEIVHAPLLMDHKYHDPTDEGAHVSIPQADVGFISGSVNNDHHLEVLVEMRRQCTFLIAMGTCATHGGIPALMNSWKQPDGWLAAMQTDSTDSCDVLPNNGVPVPLDKVYACDEKVTIDLFLPGCPPQPEQIEEVIKASLEGREPKLSSRSVCDTCPVERTGKGNVSKVRRFLVNADYDTSEQEDKMRCLLEQGFLCLGPVTRAGCAGDGAPRCIHARVPCRGCYGPIRREGNQMLDMMNAMTSNNIDYATIVDRRSILRFSGAHGLLRPLRKKGK